MSQTIDIEYILSNGSLKVINLPVGTKFRMFDALIGTGFFPVSHCQLVVAACFHLLKDMTHEKEIE